MAQPMRQIREFACPTVPPDQPTYHLVQGDILDIPTEAIVLQLDAGLVNDQLAAPPAQNRVAWAQRIGDQAGAHIALYQGRGPLGNAWTRPFTGHGGTLGTRPVGNFPIMVIAVNLEEPPALLGPDPAAPMAAGRDNPDWRLRRAINNILCRAYNIRRDLPANDALIPAPHRWRLRAPVSIAIPLIGSKSGNIMSAVAGWYRNATLDPVDFGTPADRVATIQDVFLVVPNTRKSRPGTIESAWLKAWGRYLPADNNRPLLHPLNLRNNRAEANNLRQLQRRNRNLAGHAPAINDGRMDVPNDFARVVRGVAPEYPLNNIPWVQELVTAAWINRNYRIARGGRMTRITEE
ncbi:hypothetical protein SBOR_7411 [Sclerotinia borealis F-4128]|uniref:Uncharacterized protein n=1 Tax=Sclerotinia borealis (strain F-4128) TaxID=1432307 RepID=W9C612_SCLBF|nr:hypothetical protein SBOR_7411 [Sclerotinia borealis F-4128]